MEQIAKELPGVAGIIIVIVLFMKYIKSSETRWEGREEKWGERQEEHHKTHQATQRVLRQLNRTSKEQGDYLKIRNGSLEENNKMVSKTLKEVVSKLENMDKQQVVKQTVEHQTVKK